MSVKKVLKNELQLNPVKHLKTGYELAKNDLTHHDPGEDPAVTQARVAQQEQLALLNDQENYRRKSILNSANGLRSYSGSAQDRTSSAFQPPTPVTAPAPAGAANAGRLAAQRMVGSGRAFGTIL